MKRSIRDRINWDEQPPDPNVMYCPILSPSAGQRIVCYVCSPGMVGVKTHWIGERTTGCIGRANGCEGCLANRSSKWKGYVGVWRPDDCRCWLAEFTPGSMRDVGSILLLKSNNVRGYRLTLSRPGTSPKGALRAALEAPPHGKPWVSELPYPWDVRDSLMLVWERLGINDAHAAEFVPEAEEGDE